MEEETKAAEIADQLSYEAMMRANGDEQLEQDYNILFVHIGSHEDPSFECEEDAYLFYEDVCKQHGLELKLGQKHYIPGTKTVINVRFNCAQSIRN